MSRWILLLSIGTLLPLLLHIISLLLHIRRRPHVWLLLIWWSLHITLSVLSLQWRSALLIRPRTAHWVRWVVVRPWLEDGRFIVYEESDINVVRMQRQSNTDKVKFK